MENSLTLSYQAGPYDDSCVDSRLLPSQWIKIISQCRPRMLAIVSFDSFIHKTSVRDCMIPLLSTINTIGLQHLEIWTSITQFSISSNGHIASMMARAGIDGWDEQWLYVFQIRSTDESGLEIKESQSLMSVEEGFQVGKRRSRYWYDSSEF